MGTEVQQKGVAPAPVQGSTYQEVSPADYAQPPYRSIGQIASSWYPTEKLMEYGTGYVWDDQHVVTCAHVVYSRLYKLPPLNQIRFNLPGGNVMSPVDVLVNEDFTFWPPKDQAPPLIDLAILKFPAGTFAANLALPPQQLTDPQITGAQVMVPGWVHSPHDTFQYANQVGACTPKITEIWYPISTTEAMSGAPVVWNNGGTWFVVATHCQGAENAGYNIGARFTRDYLNSIERLIDGD